MARESSNVNISQLTPKPRAEFVGPSRISSVAYSAGSLCIDQRPPAWISAGRYCSAKPHARTSFTAAIIVRFYSVVYCVGHVGSIADRSRRVQTNLIKSHRNVSLISHCWVCSKQCTGSVTCLLSSDGSRQTRNTMLMHF